MEAGTSLGSYRLLGLIGQGGVGQVYAAEHMKLGRRVALKVLRSRWARQPEMVRRFFLEAQAVNRIKHPNIVQITDLVEADGLAYYIMELLTGRSLRQHLAERKMLPVDELLRIAVPVADALAAVHAAGIIHRDLKPDNIFLAEGDGPIVKILDFGLAKLRQPPLDQPPGHDTEPGTVLGTPEYLAPEQVRGRPPDHRVDLYALGAILYEMLTGARPLVGATLGETMVQVATATPVPPSKRSEMQGREVPPRLEAVILRCLEKEPDRRPQSAGEVLDELRALEAWTAPSRSKRLLLVALAGLATAGLAIGIGLHLPRRSGQRPGAAVSGRREGAPIATLTQLWGDVQRHEAGAQVWRGAERNSRLRYHDGLKTGRGARSRVGFDRGGELDLDELSEVQIEQPADGGPAPVPVIVAGTIRGEAAPGVPFRFVGPDHVPATVVARGGPAALRIRTGPGGAVELAVLRGSATVESAGGSVTLTGAQLIELRLGRAGAPLRLARFPSLLAPAVDAIVAAGGLRLAWEAVPEAKRYRVQVSRSTSFDGDLVDDLIDATEARLSSLAPGRYLWRVSTIGDHGHEGEFGFARRFSVQPGQSAAAAETAMLAPVDGALVEHGRDPGPTTFRWRGQRGMKYLLVLAAEPTLAKRITLRRAAWGGRTSAGPLPPGTYYWGVYRLEEGTARPLFREPYRLRVVRRAAPELDLPPIRWK